MGYITNITSTRSSNENQPQPHEKTFQRACQAEEEGRISLAVELYDSLGRSNDVNRLLKRQRGD